MRPQAARSACASPPPACAWKTPVHRETLTHLGERFHRPEGQTEVGSGLGISIAQRIAALHGLALRYRAGNGGIGVVAELGALSAT